MDWIKRTLKTLPKERTKTQKKNCWYNLMLVTNVYCGNSTNVAFFEGGYFKTIDGWQFSNDPKDNHDYITHWMSIPKLPTEGKIKGNILGN